MERGEDKAMVAHAYNLATKWQEGMLVSTHDTGAQVKGNGFVQVRRIKDVVIVWSTFFLLIPSLRSKLGVLWVGKPLG